MREIIAEIIRNNRRDRTEYRRRIAIYEINMEYVVQVRLELSRASEVLVRLRCGRGVRSSGAPLPSLCVALYDGSSSRLDAACARLALARAVSHDGVYAYPSGGVCIPRAKLEAGSYVLVVSTFDPWDGPYELRVWSARGAARLDTL